MVDGHINLIDDPRLPPEPQDFNIPTNKAETDSIIQNLVGGGSIFCEAEQLISQRNNVKPNPHSWPILIQSCFSKIHNLYF